MATIRKHRGKRQAIVKRKGQGTKGKSFHIKQDAQKWAHCLTIPKEPVDSFMPTMMY